MILLFWRSEAKLRFTRLSPPDAHGESLCPRVFQPREAACIPQLGPFTALLSPLAFIVTSPTTDFGLLASLLKRLVRLYCAHLDKPGTSSCLNVLLPSHRQSPSPYKVTYSRVLGLGHGHLWGVLFSLSLL